MNAFRSESNSFAIGQLLATITIELRNLADGSHDIDLYFRKSLSSPSAGVQAALRALYREMNRLDKTARRAIEERVAVKTTTISQLDSFADLDLGEFALGYLRGIAPSN